MRVTMLLLTTLGLLTMGQAAPQSKPAPQSKQAPPTKPAPTQLDLPDLINYMEGDYTIVGKKPDSQTTYTGRLTFFARGKALGFTRTVGRHTVRGMATFHKADEYDRLTFLTMRFQQDGREYAASYQWSYDYDNYARFTGYVYVLKGNTKAAGLEMLFPLAPSVQN